MNKKIMNKNAYDEYMSNERIKGKGKCFTIKEILSSEYYKKHNKGAKRIFIDPKSEMKWISERIKSGNF